MTDRKASGARKKIDLVLSVNESSCRRLRGSTSLARRARRAGSDGFAIEPAMEGVTRNPLEGESNYAPKAKAVDRSTSTSSSNWGGRIPGRRWHRNDGAALSPVTGGASFALGVFATGTDLGSLTACLI